MPVIFRKFFLIIILLLCSCARDQQTLTIKGSTTVEPITRIAAERYSEKRNINIKIESGGSHSGFSALIKGDCDIVDSSTEISEAERETALSNGVQIREFVIAYDLIVPIVHPRNPVDNLSMDQLRDIFSCKAQNWKRFGGMDGEIKIVIRDKFSGTHDVWNKFIMCTDGDSKGASVQSSNSGVLSHVSKNEEAIGYISYGFLNRDIKPLSINGIKPSSDPGKAGEFPVKRKLYLYVDDNRFSQPAKSFIIFLLSRQGQEIIREAGFVPVTMAYME